jgi:hypothetical protein
LGFFSLSPSRRSTITSHAPVIGARQWITSKDFVFRVAGDRWWSDLRVEAEDRGWDVQGAEPKHKSSVEHAPCGYVEAISGS